MSCSRILAGLALVASATAGTAAGAAEDFCSRTADTLLQACRAGADSDALVSRAVCLNLSDAPARDQCRTDMRDTHDEAMGECRDQHDWRLKACKTVGESRYDPLLDPAQFDDPRNPSHPNPYFPLDVGNTWRYKGGDEVNTVEVLDETKRIVGLDAIVVEDLVKANGVLTEATHDWYTFKKDGTVWYMGEETGDYETFPGDDPMKPELVTIEGSFKAGREGDKPGIIFLATPTKGAVYFEEFSLANAEDVTEVLSTTYSYGSDATLDEGVPQALADRFCSSGDCVVTKNFSLLEPDIVARKYYARGVGVILELETTGEVSQLVDCNFDDRCDNLPQP